MPRAEPFQRNEQLEALLARLEGPLAAAEHRLLDDISPTPRPVVLICACGRAGATLLLQLLASSGSFGYPSNLMSRFYAAPVLGALVQRMLLDPDLQFRTELDLAADPPSFRSELGKTEGALSPNEFYYFWRRWFAEVDGHPPTGEDLSGSDFGGLRREVGALATVIDKPLAFKASLMNWALPVVAQQLPDAYVVFLRRDRLFNAQSLLEARRRHSGSEHDWYSFRPPHVEPLLGLPPAEQVAGQVVMTERAIEQGIGAFDPARVVDVSYEELCDRPASVWNRITTALDGRRDLGPAPRDDPFPSGNVRRLPDDVLGAIERALERFGTDIA